MSKNCYEIYPQGVPLWFPGPVGLEQTTDRITELPQKKNK